MSEVYNHKVVEKKWQKVWDDEKAFAATNDYSKPKYYALVEFPYPSGQGLHVGHPRPYTALDIVARKRRMQGYNVLYPMGWDAFGLPTENYAIKNKIHPKIVTENNVKHFKEQLHSLGYSFDWDREINTTDPNYYKWTQWIFLKLFKAGLAYKKEMPINWCTSCKVGLANEEVVNGVCERCGAPVVRKVKSEWMLKITEYADKLIEGLNDVDYIERVKVSQKNWIGRSTGAEVDFQIKDTEDKLRIYTTRCDTLFGVTYMVVSPEHPYLDKYKDQIKNWDEILAYREQASRKSDFERAELAKDKTGVEIDGEYQMISMLQSMAQMKKEYERVKDAMTAVEQKGYGVVMPGLSDIRMENPVLIQHGGKFGVKMRALSPSIHMIKANIETEIAPIVGSEEQANDLIEYIKAGEESGEGIWTTNIFGKSVGELMEDGIRSKIMQMDDECQMKLQDKNIMKRVKTGGSAACFFLPWNSAKGSVKCTCILMLWRVKMKK